MRLLGTIEGQTLAEYFVAFLMTRKISAQVEATTEQPDRWDVWIRDEDRLDEAKAEFVKFLADPDQNVYREAVAEAQQLVRERRKQREQAVKRIQVGTRAFAPKAPKLTIALILLSIVVSLVTDFMNAKGRKGLGVTTLRQMSFVDLDREKPNEIASLDPLATIKRGEVWRVITPIFLHGNPIHLLFNMMMLFQFGRLLEQREGTFLLGGIILITAAFSNCLQGCVPASPMGLAWLGGSPVFGGMSGVVYGLFGYLWAKSSIRPDRLPQVAPSFVLIMLIWMIAGFANVLGPVANLAHFGGLVAGLVLGFLFQNAGRK